MAIEQNICGHEIGDLGEFSVGSPGGLPGGGVQSIQTGGRSGPYCLRTIPGILAGNGYFAFFPAGAVIGTSGTVSSGNKKRARVRVYVRIISQSGGFPTSQERVFGFGGDTGTAGVWIDGNHRFGIRVTNGTVVMGSAQLTAATWYQFTLDVLLDVSANTLVTATLTVQDDSETPVFSETITTSGTIGASDLLEQLGVGEIRQSIFGISGTYEFDDWVYQGTSDADAVSAITLPTDTHIFAAVVPTGVALNQWETGTYTNVDEIPINVADTMSSVLGSGTEVEFTHSSGITLQLGRIQAQKLYCNAKVASGTGDVDFMLNGVALTRTLTVNYPAVANPSYNPKCGILVSTFTPKQFSASTFGVKKQNGTQQTFIANIALEVLGSSVAYGSNTQIRGNTQIKAGTVYDAQISDDARIQARKIFGLGTGPAPVFFPDEHEDQLIIPGPPGTGSSSSSRSIFDPPVFIPDVGSDAGDPMIVPGPAGAAGAAGTSGISYAGEVLLAELTAAASSSLDFTTRNIAGQSGAIFQSDYEEYRIEIIGLVPATTAVDLQWRLSTDGGASYDATAKYVSTILAWINSVSATAGEDPGTATNQFAMRKSGIVSNDASYGVDASLRLAIPGGSKFPRFDGEFGFITNATVSQAVDFRGVYISATAINAIRFLFSSGNIASGKIRIYGLTKTAVSLQQAPAHGVVLLATQTPSAVASVDFISRNVGSLSGAIFQSDYDEYVIEFVNIVNGSAAIPQIRMSTDGGATFDSGTNYDWGWSFHYSGAPGSIFAAATNQINFRDSATTLAANGNWTGRLRLFNPLSTSLFKTLVGDQACRDGTVGMIWFHGGGAYRSTTAVNALRVLVSAGTFSGSINIYGVVKDATYPVSSIMTGTAASRPTFGNAGRIYLPNDGFSIARDSGTDWKTFGPVFPFTPPPTGVWSWQNQGTASITEAKDALQMYSPAHGATQDLPLREKNTRATPYTMTAYLTAPPINKNNHQWGVFLRQAGAGTGQNRIIAMFNGQAAASVSLPGLDVFIADLATPTSALGTFYRAVNIAEVIRWFRIADDGTNITFSISADGQNWVPLLTQSRLTYLLQGPDRIGFFYHPSNSATPNLDGALTVLSWKEE